MPFISDITINIIRRKLVEFTQEQCLLWGIPMQMKPTGPCWDDDAKEWRGGHDLLPVYRGYPIILVPKRAVRYRLAVDYGEYYDKHVVEHIRQEYEQQENVNSAASLTKVLRGRLRVTKKSVKEKNPSSKIFLREFSEEHPDVLAAYKREAQQNVESGKYRPSDSGIYEKEKDVAHSRRMYMIEEVPQVHNGDVIIINAPVVNSVIGQGTQTNASPPGRLSAAGIVSVIQFIAGDRGGGPRALLQIPREEKAIQDAVGLGGCRDGFRFAPSIHAASINDVIACRRHRPAIVHFAGHGEDRLMVLVRDRDPLVVMTPLDLSQAETLFATFPADLRLVVFNTCHSLELAKHLTENGTVSMAIGVDGLISDDRAVQFAITFYRQLAEGEPVQRAFDLASLPPGEHGRADRPRLLHAAGVDPSTATFVVPSAA